MCSRNFDKELENPENWNTADEVHLLHCTMDNEPVGINKHLQMSIICSRFRDMTNKNVSSDTLWRKLGTWYNFEKLDEIEPLPFNNDEEDFLLPSEIIPESYRKHLSEDEKKNIDFSGQFEEYLRVSEPEGDSQEFSSGLGGSEKMKWFECPQYHTEEVEESTEIEGEAMDITSEPVPSSNIQTQRPKNYYSTADMTEDSREPKPGPSKESKLPDYGES